MQVTNSRYRDRFYSGTNPAFKSSVIALGLLLLAGCATTTPDMTPLPSPDISSSDQIDNSVRRPVPVFGDPPPDQAIEEDETAGGREVLPGPPTFSNESVTTSRTVLALLDRASQQQQSGQPEKAAAILERALRIEPRNAHLWHRLALIRFQQGQYTQAESLAAKSSTLAQGDWHLKQKNAELIEQVRQRRPYIQ